MTSFFLKRSFQIFSLKLKLAILEKHRSNLVFVVVPIFNLSRRLWIDQYWRNFSFNNFPNFSEEDIDAWKNIFFCQSFLEEVSRDKFSWDKLSLLLSP